MRAIGKTRNARLLLRLALYGGGLFVGVPLAFSHVMTKTYRLESPSKATRPYEELPLVSEGLKLRAWLVRGEPGKPAAIVIHGLGDSL